MGVCAGMPMVLSGLCTVMRWTVHQAGLDASAAGKPPGERACITMALSGSCAAISWKFFTLASLTRPRKFRHQQCRLSFQCGGLFSSSTPPARPHRAPTPPCAGQAHR